MCTEYSFSVACPPFPDPMVWTASFLLGILRMNHGGQSQVRVQAWSSVTIDRKSLPPKACHCQGLLCISA